MLLIRGLSWLILFQLLGTALALDEGKEAGAFAALAMSLMGIVTALLLPVCVTLWLLL